MTERTVVEAYGKVFAPVAVEMIAPLSATAPVFDIEKRVEVA